MATIEETAVEVLRLDAEATPGPWRIDESEAAVSSGEPGTLSVELVAQAERDQDSELIATYRAAAPELAREVLRLRADTAYRPGLPSVEQVREHEARCPGAGGWTAWQRQYPGNSANIVLLIAVAGAIWVADGGGRKRLASTACQWRPCLPDGTPCPWGDP